MCWCVVARPWISQGASWFLLVPSIVTASAESSFTFSRVDVPDVPFSSTEPSNIIMGKGVTVNSCTVAALPVFAGLCVCGEWGPLVRPGDVVW